MKLIEVTEPDGKKVTINAAYIIMLAPTNDPRYATVITMAEVGTLHVKESVPEILTILSAINPV